VLLAISLLDDPSHQLVLTRSKTRLPVLPEMPTQDTNRPWGKPFPDVDKNPFLLRQEHIPIIKQIRSYPSDFQQTYRLKHLHLIPTEGGTKCIRHLFVVLNNARQLQILRQLRLCTHPIPKQYVNEFSSA